MGVDGDQQARGGPHARPCSCPVLPQPDSLPYDERPLPVTRKQLGAAVSEAERRDVLGDEAQRADTAGEPEPLTEKALREASSAVDVLGEALVRKEANGGWGVRLHRAPGPLPVPPLSLPSSGNVLMISHHVGEHEHQLGFQVS